MINLINHMNDTELQGRALPALRELPTPSPLKFKGVNSAQRSLSRYVIGTLELLVAENYMIVYLNGATSRKKMPTVGWLRKCYQQIDRR